MIRTHIHRHPVMSILSLLFAIACSPGDMDQYVPADHLALARSVISDLSRGSSEVAVSAVPERPGRDAFVRKLEATAEVLAGSEGSFTRLLSLHWLAASSMGTAWVLVFEHPSGEHWWRVTVTTTGSESGPVLMALQAAPSPLSAEEQHGLAFVERSPLHDFMIVLAALAVLGSIAAAFVAVTHPLRRRWLWALGCLVGLTRLSLDWTTGEITFQPLSAQLLSASFVRPGLTEPWMLSVSIPVFALLVFFKVVRARGHTPTRAGDPRVRGPNPRMSPQRRSWPGPAGESR